MSNLSAKVLHERLQSPVKQSSGSVHCRLSFLSGHSSFSFYCATYLVVYLQARLSNFPLSADNQALTTTYRMLKVKTCPT